METNGRRIEANSIIGSKHVGQNIFALVFARYTTKAYNRMRKTADEIRVADPQIFPSSPEK